MRDLEAKALTYRLLILRMTTFLALLSVIPSTHAQEPEIKIAADEVAILGYGSLVNQTSMMRTLNRCYQGAMTDVVLSGYRRTLRAVVPNFDAKLKVDGLDRHFKAVFFEEKSGRDEYPDGVAYYNMEPAKGESMSATLFVIKKADLAGFNEREEIYNLTEIDPKLLSANIKSGHVYAYVADPRFYPENFSKTFPGHVGKIQIRKSYLEIVDNILQTKPGAYQKAFNLAPTKLSTFSDQKAAQPKKSVASFNPSSCDLVADRKASGSYHVSEIKAGR